MCLQLSLRSTAISLALVALLNPSVKRNPTRTITRCAEDGIAFEVSDAMLHAPQDRFVGTLGDVTVRTHYLSTPGDHAVFIFSRANRTFFQVEIPELSNPNGWMPISDNRKNFAITWSNGGAAGGWSTQVFKTLPDGTIVERKALMASLEKNFMARHNCAARGDNFEAVRWMDDDHLLIAASVYGTGDCGTSAGYTEGYLIKLSTGAIERRMSERELLTLPTVCTWNEAPISPH